MAPTNVLEKTSLVACLVAASLSPVLARTDLDGCTSSSSVASVSGIAPYATVIWYVPGTGELCELLDCGGGRAPPKTTVPGCAGYEGTETYSPKYISVSTSAPVTKTTATGTATITTSATLGGSGSESDGAGQDATRTSSTTAATTTGAASALAAGAIWSSCLAAGIVASVAML